MAALPVGEYYARTAATNRVGLGCREPEVPFPFCDVRSFNNQKDLASLFPCGGNLITRQKVCAPNPERTRRKLNVRVSVHPEDALVQIEKEGCLNVWVALYDHHAFRTRSRSDQFANFCGGKLIFNELHATGTRQKEHRHQQREGRKAMIGFPFAIEQ